MKPIKEEHDEKENLIHSYNGTYKGNKKALVSLKRSFSAPYYKIVLNDHKCTITVETTPTNTTTPTPDPKQ